MTDIKEVVKLPISLSEDEAKGYLEQWVEDVFPMFYYTDARVTYGYDWV